MLTYDRAALLVALFAMALALGNAPRAVVFVLVVVSFALTGLARRAT